MIPWKTQGKPKNIAVIGDLILDEYLEGEVQRISPEAPVPVHLVKSTIHTAGGAGNSARNIALSGGHVSLFSVWGDDEGAGILKKILSDDGIDLSGVLTADDRPTIRKTRVTAGSQQLLRLDWEKDHDISESLQDRLFELFAAGTFDGVLVSDYGKGALSGHFLEQIFTHCRKHKIPVVVDPKGKDFSRYIGCDLITPNLREACESLGVSVPALATENAESLAVDIRNKFGLDDVLITMGPQGMLLSPKNVQLSACFEAPRAREVFDVSGAGDTVAAIMTLCRASQVPHTEAVHLANIAAGLVVEKWGTHPVSLDELESALQGSEPVVTTHEFKDTSLKILTKSELMGRLETQDQTRGSVVFTNGCFDILHAGHLSYLEKARSLGGLLIVGVNSDGSVRRLKGDRRPVIPLEQRMRLLAGLSCIDYVVAFDEDTPLQLIEALKPDILVKGADYTEDKIVGAEFVRKSGGKIQRIELVEGVSTTKILESAQSPQKTM